MNLKRVDDTFFVAPQIAIADVSEIANLGIKSIIVNRPDGESPDQSDFELISQAARSSGLEVCYIPIPGRAISDESVREFGAALSDLPTPIVSYCRTGTRSISLWALSKVDTYSVSKIMTVTRQLGYDLTWLQPRLEGNG